MTIRSVHKTASFFKEVIFIEGIGWTILTFLTFDAKGTMISVTISRYLAIFWWILGPTQVKWRLLISSIFDAINQHFSEMLEFNL